MFVHNIKSHFQFDNSIRFNSNTTITYLKMYMNIATINSISSYSDGMKGAIHIHVTQKGRRSGIR